MTQRNATAPRRTTRQPRITLTVEDHEALSRLVRSAEHTMPEVAEFLEAEIDRAHVLAKGRRPTGHVTMGSQLSYRDDSTGRTQRFTLVFPPEADIGAGRISVLTPIGAALIGLKVGDGIDWTTRTGEVRHLTVVEVGDGTAEAAAAHNEAALSA